MSISAPIAEYHLLSTVMADIGSRPGPSSGVSSLTFDNSEELIWMGNASGHVTSYYTSALQKYTSFHIDAVNDVRDVLTCSAGILSLTRSSLRLSIRRGLTVFTHKSELYKDMQCMALMPSGLLMMGGHQSKLIEMDIERVKHVRVTDISDSGCVVIRQNSRFVFHGDAQGKITVRDPSTMKVEHEFQTHSSLSDFDVHGNLLITCGYSKRHESYIPDQFLMVYDLRMKKAISPIAMPNFSPYLLRFMPLYASKFAVCSQSGQFQLIEATDHSLSAPRFIHQIELQHDASITTFDVSSSSQSLAFGDDRNYIYLFGASNEVTFNKSSQATELADPIELFRPLPITDRWTPLSSVSQINYYGMTEKLLSDMSPEACRKTYRPPPPIDADITAKMRMVGSIGYVRNEGKKLNLGALLTQPRVCNEPEEESDEKVEESKDE